LSDHIPTAESRRRPRTTDSRTGWLRRGLLLAALSLIASPLAAQQENSLIEDRARVDTGWPREHVGPDGDRVLVFAPQIENWTNFEVVEMRVAVAVMPAGIEQPYFGAIRVTAKTETNLEARTVVAFSYEVTEATFPAVGPDSTSILLDKLFASIPETSRTLSLDLLLSHVDQPLLGRGADGLSMEPPTIFVSEVPARLVLFDGEPILSPVEGTNLLYAVNTNWDVFLETGGSRYFVRDESVWFTAPEVTGPWERATELPNDLGSLPENENWSDVRASLPGRWIALEEVPTFLVSLSPAELIVFDGPPELSPIEGTALLWATNTELDVFFHGDQARYYFLVAGRWFSTSDLSGGWGAVADLPAGFALIPEDHPRAHVLASVPGTVHAAEAVLQAEIPQKATVDRSTASATVEYAGEPEFEPIEGTDMLYAVNTSSDVIRIGGMYHLCRQGVWFSATSATGPWVAASTVPDEVYTIPPTSPVYHTTYVYIYDSTPTTVTYGYTPGYLGMYVVAGVVIWGTGWHYDPWYWHGPYPYPHYYWHPYTYGAATWYNPRTGFYGRGAGVYGPYGGYGAAAVYNPRTGTYGRGARLYGPYGTTAVGEAYNPRTGGYARTRQSRNPYSQWGGTVVTRGDDWAWGRHYSDSRGTVGEIRTSEGGRIVGGVGREGSAFVGRGADGDVYAGRDGNLYRRDGSDWQRYGNGDWQGVDRSELQTRIPPERRSDAAERLQSRPQIGRPEAGAGQLRGRTGQRDVFNQLERDRSARSIGKARTRDWRSNRGLGSSRAGTGRSGGRRAGRSRGRR